MYFTTTDVGNIDPEKVKKGSGFIAEGVLLFRGITFLKLDYSGEGEISSTHANLCFFLTP